jgi:hypothetical protein
MKHYNLYLGLVKLSSGWWSPIQLLLLLLLSLLLLLLLLQLLVVADTS